MQRETRPAWKEAWPGQLALSTGRVMFLGRRLGSDPVKEGDILEGTRGGSRGGSRLGIHEEQRSEDRTWSSGRTRLYCVRGQRARYLYKPAPEP